MQLMHALVGWQARSLMSTMYVITHAVLMMLQRYGTIILQFLVISIANAVMLVRCWVQLMQALGDSLAMPLEVH